MYGVFSVVTKLPLNYDYESLEKIKKEIIFSIEQILESNNINMTIFKKEDLLFINFNNKQDASLFCRKFGIKNDEINVNGINFKIKAHKRYFTKLLIENLDFNLENNIFKTLRNYISNKDYIDNCFFFDYKYVYFSSIQNALDFNSDKHVINNVLLKTRIIKETNNFLCNNFKNVDEEYNIDTDSTYDEYLNKISECDNIIKHVYNETKKSFSKIEYLIDEIFYTNYIKRDKCKPIMNEMHNILSKLYNLKIDISELDYE